MGLLYRIKILNDEEHKEYHEVWGYLKEYLGYKKECGFYLTNQRGASIINEIYLEEDELLKDYLSNKNYQLEIVNEHLHFANWYGRQR